MTDRETSLRDTSARGKAAIAEVSMLLAAFFVGADVVSVKYALEGFPPLVLMPIRYTLAGLLLLASLRLLRRGIGLVPRDLADLAGLGLVGVSLNQVGYTVGLSLTSGSNAALIFASAPVWDLLLGAVLGLERPTAGGALGLALAVGGVALVVGGGLGYGGASVSGDLLVCLSTFSWGAYAVALHARVAPPRPARRRRLDDAHRRRSVVVLGEDLRIAKITGATSILLGVYLARRA